MHQPDEHNKKDSELADFADRVLGGGNDQTASAADEELLSLEKTILRLGRAFPPEPLENAKAKQMLVRLKARVRREEEEQKAKSSFWKRFFAFQANPQVALLVAVAAVVVLVIVNIPSVQPPSGSSLSGTAFSGNGIFTVIGVIGILLVILWISRRK